MGARDNRSPDICLYEFYVAELYHAERNHQGVGNQLLEPLARVGSSNDPIYCRERLGGMLNFYHHEAA
jgi:putative transposase